MKKIPYLILNLLILTSCTFEEVGPSGQDGFDGRDGIDGVDGKDGEEAFVFEFDLEFVSPDYRTVLEFPGDFTMLESDVALVYLLWEVTDNKEIWRLAPQNVFMSEGTLQYNYDFTKKDVVMFLEANYPLSLVPSKFLTNWLARVVVVPGKFSSGRTANTTVDYSDYDAVITHYELTINHEKSNDVR